MEYESKYVKCPYYISSTHTYMTKANLIRCEGVADGCVTSLSFETKEAENEYRMKHCNNIQGYHKCLICKALDRKWGVGDG